MQNWYVRVSVHANSEKNVVQTAPLQYATSLHTRMSVCVCVCVCASAFLIVCACIRRGMQKPNTACLWRKPACISPYTCMGTCTHANKIERCTHTLFECVHIKGNRAYPR
jgi:hypothetical protein